MRLRKVNADLIFPQDPIDDIVTRLCTPDLECIAKCIDFKIHQVNHVQVLSDTIKKNLIQTDFGKIELLIERIDSSQELNRQLIEWYNIKIPEEIWAATYQQTLITTGQKIIVCLTFREVTKHVKSIKVDKALIELPKTLYFLNECGLDIPSPLTNVIQSEITGKYHLDYFHIETLKRTSIQATKCFLEQISRFPMIEDKLQQTIYLLEDEAYSWKINKEQLVKLSQIQNMDWFLLSVLMNLPFISSTLVSFSLSESFENIKKLTIQQLSGSLFLQKYPNILLEFRSGKCINQYKNYTSQQLRTHFFQLLKTYRVVKRNVLSVTKEANTINQNESFIIIDEMVEKIDCVQFFIIYMKYFALSIEYIIFKKQTNELWLTLTQGKYVVIKFHKDYIVKQEQISIIINKSNLNNCTIDLENSNVSDKLLILLSNIDKSLKIKKLNLAKCSSLTQFGLNTLFESQLLRELTEVNLSSTAASQQTIQLMKSNLVNLQKLIINNCQYISQELNFKQFPKLQKLSALGTWIDPVFSSKLKILRLSFQFPIEHLKTLSRMPLQELKLKLVQNRKQQIVNFVSNLYSSSTHYTKQFMEGSAVKTLKYLDLSESSVKFKLIKSLFTIKSLVQLSLSRCSNLGDQFQGINKDIQTINLQQVNLTPRNIKALLHRCTFVKNLNIRSSLSKKQTIQMVQIVGKNINELFITDSEYSEELLKYLNRGGTANINKLSIKINIMNEKTDRMLRQLSSNPQKLINIECDQQAELIKKIYSIMGRKQKTHLRFRHQQIFVVDKRLEERNKRSDWLELSSCKDTTLFVHNIIYRSRNKQNIKVNLKNNRYLSATAMDIISVFARTQIRALDIRNCLFTFEDVSTKIMSWQGIEQVNQGNFLVKFNHKNFVALTQKYLKFFMKIHNMKELVVEVKKITDGPFLFSVLHYIINHHKLTLERFSLQIQEIDLQLKDQIAEFWEALLTTITLKDFSFCFKNCTNFDSPHFEKLKSLNYLNLHKLQLQLPHQLPFYPKIPGLKSLCMRLSQYIFIKKRQAYVNDSYITEIIKNLSALQVLNLDISRTEIQNVQKFSSALKSLKKLKQFSVDFEYCPIRTMSCIGILGCLRQAKLISKVYMNVSFTSEGVQNMAGQLISYSDQINQPILEVVALRVAKQQIHLQKQLEQRYISLIV